MSDLARRAVVARTQRTPAEPASSRLVGFTGVEQYHGSTRSPMTIRVLPFWGGVTIIVDGGVGVVAAGVLARCPSSRARGRMTDAVGDGPELLDVDMAGRTVLYFTRCRRSEPSALPGR